MSYDLNFSSFVPYTGAFLLGAATTLQISIISFVVGTVAGLGLTLVLLLIRRNFLLLLVNDALRALPPLVLIFFFYFFPYKSILGIEPPGPILCAILGLAFSQAVYTADVTYFARLNISPALTDAGRALGLTNRDIWLNLILPDLLRQTIPVQVAFLIGIIRLSSLGAVIGAQDVVYVARIATAQNFRSIEAWIIVGFVYILLVTPITVLARTLERSRWVRRRF
jgi:polar amino acid transport system permease protein